MPENFKSVSSCKWHDLQQPSKASKRTGLSESLYGLDQLVPGHQRAVGFVTIGLFVRVREKVHLVFPDPNEAILEVGPILHQVKQTFIQGAGKCRNQVVTRLLGTGEYVGVRGYFVGRLAPRRVVIIESLRVFAEND